MRYAGVVFDLDGTLLDTLRDIADAANAVLAAQGFPTHDLEAYRYFVGEGVAQLYRYLLPPENHTDAWIERCGVLFRESYERHWNVHTAAYPGVEELLQQLCARSVRLAVLSNKPDVFTKKCVARYLAQYPFAVVLGQRDGVPRKPDPTAALEIARSLELSPADCVYLGDTGIDMQTAVRAGMLAVGAQWGFRPAEELLRHGAQAIIGSPGELLDIVEAGIAGSARN
jgi:phosphoglycolate phosphatase